MLKLEVGRSKKISDPNFSSHGASVELAIERAGWLVDEPDQLRERIRTLLAAAKASIDEELQSRLRSADEHHGAATNGHVSINGRGTPHDGTRLATASQVLALQAIAARCQVNLADVLGERFETHDPTALTITEASCLIDELKSKANGNRSPL